MTFTKLTKQIINEKAPCLFISPHLDDAVLSAGDFILFLIEQKIPVTVITVFTKISPKPYTLSAKSFIRQCGYNDAELLFADRRSEDKEIFKKIGIQTEHFDFVDATWRKKENISSFHIQLMNRVAVSELRNKSAQCFAK